MDTDVKASLLVSLLFISLVVSGCGGGGSGSGGGSGDNNTTQQKQTEGTIVGQAVMGPIMSGTVRAYTVSKGMPDKLISLATTDTGGNYSLSIENYLGPLFIEVTEGTYIDEVTGATLNMPTDFQKGLSAVVSGVDDGATVNVEITPLTTMASSLAMSLPDKLTSADISRANTLIGGYYHGIDILATHPINPLVTDSGINASVDEIDYGMILGGISQSADTFKLDPMALVQALAQDVSDLSFDGKQSGTDILVGGTSPLAANAGNFYLQDGIKTFNAINQSGATVSSGLINQLLLTTASVIPLNIAGQYSTQVFGLTDVINFNCSDPAFNTTISYDSGAVTVDTQTDNDWTGTIDLRALANGSSYIYTASLTGKALTSKNIIGTFSSTLTIDNQIAAQGSGTFSGAVIAGDIHIDASGQETIQGTSQVTCDINSAIKAILVTPP